MGWKIYKKGSNGEYTFIGELAELNQLEGFVEAQVSTTGGVRDPASTISNRGDSIILTSNNALQGVQSSAYVAIRHDEGVRLTSIYGLNRKIELIISGIDETIKKSVLATSSGTATNTYEILDESMIATDAEVKSALGIN